MAKKSPVKSKLDMTKYAMAFKKSIREWAGRSTLEEVGQYASSRIYKTTKSGYTLAYGDTRSKLSQLSEGYKKYRKNYSKAGGKVGELFGPSRSNLTFTGQLLESISTRILPNKKQVDIYIPDSKRTSPTRISERKITPKPELTNKEVAINVAENGRAFIGMDASGYRSIMNIFLRDLRGRMRSNRLKVKP